MFDKFVEAMRGIIPQTQIVDSNGNPVTDENIAELKKSELIEYIDALEVDKRQQQHALNNLDNIKKSFSEEFYLEIEGTLLGKIQNLDKEISKAKKQHNDLKKKYADAIVYNNEGKILFLRRKNDADFAPGKLGLPGGHVDAGEDFEAAAKRELLEETNLEGTICHHVGIVKMKDAEIHYYKVDVNPEDLIILEADEHINLCWKELNELEEDDCIPGLKDNLMEFLEPKMWAVKTIKKAFELGQVKEEDYLEVLSKAKTAQLGEIREWNGQKMRKEASGWVPVSEGKGVKKEDDKKGIRSKREEEGKRPAAKTPDGEGPTPEQLAAHAKETSTEQLQTVAEDKNADPAMVEAANTELMERGVEPSVKQKLKEKVKDWHKKQVEFYQSGALDADSEDRKGLANFLAKKKDGIIHALKDEVKEFKEAGHGLKKFFSGNKADITDHEKKAMKTIAIHLGIVVGSMALTGGLSGLASKGIGALGKGIAAHYLEHSGIMRLGHVLAFAKSDEELSEEELNEIYGRLLDDLLQYIQSGNISEEDWLQIGDESKSDFSTLMGTEDEEDSEEDEEKGKEGDKKVEKSETKYGR